MNMTNIQPNKTDTESKGSHFAGIDVGAEELVLVILKNGKPFDPQKFSNTPADRARLVKKLVKLTRACRVDWPPPYSPIPWSIRGFEPAYTRKAGACAGSGTSE